MNPSNNTDLGLGDVDAFGLDEMGQPVGLSPMWGAVVGTGLGTIGAIATRQFAPKMEKHSELIGFGLGALASGSMIFFEGTRAAGWTGLASTFLNNGLRSMEKMFFTPSLPEAAAAAAVDGIRGAVIDPATVLGMAQVNPATVLGSAREDMPTLVGSVADASDRVQLVGGPTLASHSGHWGATLMGS